MNFAKRLNIPPSATLAVNTLANKKKAAGERVYNLSAGEPMVETSEHIIRAATEAITMGKTKYTPMSGIPELREVARVWMNTTYQSNFSVEETFVTNGGKFALYALCQALLNVGDEVIIVSPYWVSYHAMATLAGGKPVVLKTVENKKWKLEIDELSKLISEKTRFLILNNGSNPTGVLYTRKELKDILDVCAEKNIFVISDEVYSGLVYDEHEYISCAAFPQYKDRVVIVQSASKNFAMTGWRVGIVFADKTLVEKLSAFQGQSTSNTSSVSQWAAVGAFTYADEITCAIKSELQKRRDVFASHFEELFSVVLHKPAVGMYFFIPLSAFGESKMDSVAFCTRVLEEANVAIVPGVAFDMEGYVRCSFGVSEEEIIDSLRMLYSFLHVI